MLTSELFRDPPRKYAVRSINHGLHNNTDLLLEAYRDFGYGGIVTNVPYGVSCCGRSRRDVKGFTENPENLEKFQIILDKLKENDLSYWIYDEAGYPSGQGGGLVLEGHPELSAKGLYMERRITYDEPRTVKFRIDDETNRIVWAAKCPLDVDRQLHETPAIYEKMSPVSFQEDSLICELDPFEVLFIFCEKDAHYGSQGTHNTCSFRKNINIMDKRAVRRFIDCCFEPIAAACPEAYPNADNVFTDEPGLFHRYVRSYETWSRALIPWVENFFEEYEAKYGEDLRIFLPLMFENDCARAYATRIKFYALVGDLVAEAYSGQLAAWCEAHGTGFSGHYMAEEGLYGQVCNYGDYVKVLSKTSYPGLDVLSCIPDQFSSLTVKTPQIAARKKQSGMMVEICPFYNVEEFRKNPVNYMTAVMGLLYLGGVRVTHSYFAPALSTWRNNVLRRPENDGYANAEEMTAFNRYVARLGVMMEGLQNESNVFVYYPVENEQAVIYPATAAQFIPYDKLAETSIWELVNHIYENGYDFFLADCDDLTDAVRTLEADGEAKISGNRVDLVYVPRCLVMRKAAVDALKKLAEAGVKVHYLDKAPAFYDTAESVSDGANFPVCSIDDVLPELKATVKGIFQLDFEQKTVQQGTFHRDGKEIHMLCNRSGKDLTIPYNGMVAAEIWSPEDGSITALPPAGTFVLPAYRALFVLIPE